MSSLTDSTKTEMGYRYFIEGIKKDIGDIFGIEPYLDKTLREVLRKQNKYKTLLRSLLNSGSGNVA